MKHNKKLLLLITSLLLIVPTLYTTVAGQDFAATVQAKMDSAASNQVYITKPTATPTPQQNAPTQGDTAATLQAATSNSSGDQDFIVKPTEESEEDEFIIHVTAVPPTEEPGQDEFIPLVAPAQPTATLVAPTVAPAVQQNQYVPQTYTGSPKETRRNLNIQVVGVEQGSFIMGSKNQLEENKPAHNVSLDIFYIMQKETTGAQYTECVYDDVCSRAAVPVSGQYPQTNVTWYQAETFCEWIGGSLPTEAQWEKAARGTAGSPFPWGTNLTYDVSLARVNSTSPAMVGTYPNDLSPYFAFDMGGNVSEWCYDWYDSDYYKYGETTNPTGPEIGDTRVVRGGNYHRDFIQVYIRTPERDYLPDGSYPEVGFRCAFSDINR